ncbi:MAG: tRNA (adenosine(37)-N6)-threonylcarbamoyltransferase complex transferase subunit TsaD [Ahrensia sp.]|nr:tRNA (adenosine(37)-N6)-threonylcarbamoyltransferase complex transferase subunit TsaD [Ahrensia sp.]
MIVLGIETSCDETAAAVVRGSESVDSPGEILSNRILSQIADHAPFGGVVPEIAARAHLEALDSIVVSALEEADTSLTQLDAIAVTTGPGLAGGLIVGAMTARALAAVHDKPLFSINHLEGHALTARLTDGLAFPYLLLLVSGGHTQILLVRGVGQYERWATTIDDALGEAFDKTAKLLGLPYPGGPQVEMAAKNGSPQAHAFPRPLSGRDTLDMSFSGLKTAVRKAVLEPQELDDNIIADICASFQQAVGDVLADRLERAMQRYETQFGAERHLVIAGGVAANAALRHRLETLCEDRSWSLCAPPSALCTDNAAMIAWAGVERLRAGLFDTDEDGSGGGQTGIRPRWPLDMHAKSRVGAGRKGAKA